MRTPTLTPVAILATERATAGYTDNTDQGVSGYQPTGTPRKNDGIRSYWMLPGEAYPLKHDGTGWVVTNDLWAADHTYRLGTADGQGFTAELITTEGLAYELDTAKDYVMRLVPGIGHTSWGGTYVTQVAELSEAA